MSLNFLNVFPCSSELPFEPPTEQIQPDTKSQWPGSVSDADRKALRCSQILAPYMISATPVIGDFNRDGKLDGGVSIMYYTQDNSMNIFHSQKVNFRAFTIQDRLVEVYGPEILDAVDFTSYYPVEEQPWTQYMGSRGDGVFFTPT